MDDTADAPCQTDWRCPACGAEYTNPLPCSGVQCPNHIGGRAMRPLPLKASKA